LFDYATTLFVLLDSEDPKRLAAVLDEDPSLPLVAGPSFEILVDMLWEYRGAGLFWPMCLTLADSSHVLASLAVAARLLRLIQATADLAALARQPAGRPGRVASGPNKSSPANSSAPCEPRPYWRTRGCPWSPSLLPRHPESLVGLTPEALRADGGVRKRRRP
jgi:hypothetical protein